MGEIKFRAWDKVNKKMRNDFFVRADGWVMSGGKFVNTTHKKQKFIIMRSTGLKDNYGNEIYEGDILGEEKESFAVVVWIEEETRFGLKFPNGHIDKSRMTLIDWFDNWKYRNWRVIGNIYENPELLEVNK